MCTVSLIVLLLTLIRHDMVFIKKRETQNVQENENTWDQSVVYINQLLKAGQTTFFVDFKPFSMISRLKSTLDQHFGANLKNLFCCLILHQICYLILHQICYFFTFFQFFCLKNAANDYLDQILVCTAPKH